MEPRASKSRRGVGKPRSETRELTAGEDLEQFRIHQRRTKGLIKKGKIEYESKLVENIKSSCKSFYRYVK